MHTNDVSGGATDYVVTTNDVSSTATVNDISVGVADSVAAFR
jgi:hypothetical protein